MSKLKVVIPLVLFACVAGYFYAPARLFAMKAVGRSPYCPLANALESQRNFDAQGRYYNEILKGSRLVEKDPAGYHLWETPRGRWWIPAGNDFVLPYNLAEMARQVYGTGEFAIRKGDIALDCGGNVGTWTRIALDAGAAMIVAFEPAPENIESYRRNFKDEIAAGRVVLVPKGVWNREDTLLLRRDPNNSAADTFVMLQDRVADTVQAPLTTIDHALAELKLPRVDYIKMDIEGAEEKAIDGARETIAKFHPRMSVAAEHSQADGRIIPAAVRRAWPGYTLTCGPCLETTDGHIRPDILYFQ
jgi:FkbM family methyltransferase